MNKYVIVNVQASVHAATAGLVFFTRDGSLTTDPERAGIWTEGEVNADLDRFDNGTTTRAVLVESVPMLLAEAEAGETGTTSVERAMIQELRAAITQLHVAFGAPGNYGSGTIKGKALFNLYKKNQTIGAVLENRQ
jgi:hypothetical protein